MKVQLIVTRNNKRVAGMQRYEYALQIHIGNMSQQVSVSREKVKSMFRKGIARFSQRLDFGLGVMRIYDLKNDIQ